MAEISVSILVVYSGEVSTASPDSSREDPYCRAFLSRSHDSTFSGLIFSSLAHMFSIAHISIDIQEHWMEKIAEG